MIKNMAMMSITEKNEFYDSIVENMIGDKEVIGNINECIKKNLDPVLPYNSVAAMGKSYDGIDDVFKIDGIVDIINRYFVRNKIDLKCEKYIPDTAYFLRFTTFVRLKEGGMSKTDRKTERDEVEIVEDSSNDNNKEKLTKKIQESRKLISQG